MLHKITVEIETDSELADVIAEVDRNLNDHAKGYIGDPDQEVLYGATILSVRGSMT